MALIDGAIIPQGAGSRYARAEANAKGLKAASSDLNQTGNVGNQFVAFAESIDKSRNGAVGQENSYDRDPDAEANSEDTAVTPVPSQERPQNSPQTVSEIV